MAIRVDEYADAVLINVDEGDVPIPIGIQNPPPEQISIERFREILADRDREREAREAAEISKSELQESHNRFEAIKNRDEALRLNEEVSAELAEANRQKDEIANRLDEILKERYVLRSEIGNPSHEFDDDTLKLESQGVLLVDLLDFISKIHEQIYDIVKIVDSSDAEHSEFSKSLFLSRETDMEKNIRASLAGMESISSLAKLAKDKTRGLIVEKVSEIKNLNERVEQLLKEKDHFRYILKSLLSKRMISDPSSKATQLFEVEGSGLSEARFDFEFSKLVRDNGKAVDAEEDEMLTLDGAMENIVKASQIEIIELLHSLEELKAESVVLKERLESQSNELKLSSLRIQELEEEERVAQESVEDLMMDIAAAKEEITKCKVAAEQEAAAGKAVEQEFLAQISAAKQELEEARQVMLDLDKKLKFKEDTANAAMAARDAAEKSLRLADMRASRLKERLFDLTRQLEQLDSREDSRRGINKHRYVCWPWQWLGLDFGGSCHSETQQESSNKMDLSQPLL